MRTIRASEIGTFLYCRRAWWYHQQGIELGNPSELAAGNELHASHNRQVLVAGLLRGLAWLLLLAGLVLITVFVTRLLLQ